MLIVLIKCCFFTDPSQVFCPGSQLSWRSLARWRSLISLQVCLLPVHNQVNSPYVMQSLPALPSMVKCLQKVNKLNKRIRSDSSQLFFRCYYYYASAGFVVQCISVGYQEQDVVA